MSHPFKISQESQPAKESWVTHHLLVKGNKPRMTIITCSKLDGLNGIKEHIMSLL